MSDIGGKLNYQKKIKKYLSRTEYSSCMDIHRLTQNLGRSQWDQELMSGEAA